METIEVTSLEEFKKVIDNYNEKVIIKCINISNLIIKNTNHIIILYDNSSAKLYSNSSAELYSNSSAKLYENSSAELYENSSAELYENSSAKLYENSSAKLYENSSAELYSNSSAKLYSNSSAKLYRNSSAKLYENSSAELYSNSSAELYSNSSASIFSAKEVIAHHNAIIIEKFSRQNIVINDNAKIILQEKFYHTNTTFSQMHDVVDNKLVLYKITQDNYTDYYTGKIKYEIGTEVICPIFDNDSNRQCGDGLHLSPQISMAKKYNDPGKILKCLVDLGDFVIYQNDLTKVRCKKVFVLEEVDEKGNKI
jgi:hypothetical protein